MGCADSALSWAQTAVLGPGGAGHPGGGDGHWGGRDGHWGGRDGHRAGDDGPQWVNDAPKVGVMLPGWSEAPGEGSDVIQRRV